MEDSRVNISGLCFEKNRLSYCGQDCEKIPPALWKMYGTKVQHLDLSYNNLETLKGLEHFTMLHELILDNNKLGDTITFPKLLYLRTLSINNNKVVLSTLYYVLRRSLGKYALEYPIPGDDSNDNCLCLRFIDVSENLISNSNFPVFCAITDLDELINKLCEHCPSLSYLSLLSNKACPNQLSDLDKDESDYQRYRYFVIHKLRNLQFLDSRRVSVAERSEAMIRGQFMRVRRPPDDKVDASIVLAPVRNQRPLPVDLASLGKHRGAYGKCNYKYTGKHSEGNRFIVNSDL